MAAFSTSASLRLNNGTTKKKYNKSVCSQSRSTRMATGGLVSEGMESGDVLALGVATCYKRVENKLQEVLILEPLPASAVDCIARLQVPTSYRRLLGITLGEVPDSISELPSGLISDGEQVVFAEDFGERAQAASRTFRRSPEIAQSIAPGTLVEDLNYSVEFKRILNANWEPSFDDNVKQDQSIDVYNRASDEIDNTTVMAGYNS